MANDYECHINLDATEEQTKMLSALTQWKVSTVSGHPSLGDKGKLILTQHFPTKGKAESATQATVDTLRGLSIPVYRAKIEYVVFDQRSEK